MRVTFRALSTSSFPERLRDHDDLHDDTADIQGKWSDRNWLGWLSSFTYCNVLVLSFAEITRCLQDLMSFVFPNEPEPPKVN